MTIKLCGTPLCHRAFLSPTGIEAEDRLFDGIQCDAGDIASLFAIEGLAQRIDYQLISIWI
jgi:hypothetical protein